MVENLPAAAGRALPVPALQNRCGSSFVKYSSNAGGKNFLDPLGRFYPQQIEALAKGRCRQAAKPGGFVLGARVMGSPSRTISYHSVFGSNPLFKLQRGGIN